MELEKQKNISRVIHNTLKRFEDFPKDSFEIKSIDLKYVLEYTVFLEKELDRLQKENEKLKEIDLTTVHIKGVCDEKEKWRNKIREKIELIKILRQALYNESNVITILQDLLKEE